MVKCLCPDVARWYKAANSNIGTLRKLLIAFADARRTDIQHRDKVIFNIHKMKKLILEGVSK
jgi:hypothetical protein